MKIREWFENYQTSDFTLYSLCPLWLNSGIEIIPIGLEGLPG
jgi:hypothetical protein